MGYNMKNGHDENERRKNGTAELSFDLEGSFTQAEGLGDSDGYSGTDEYRTVGVFIYGFASTEYGRNCRVRRCVW